MNSAADESESTFPWLAKDVTLESILRLLVAAASLGGTLVAAFFVVPSLRFVRVKTAAYVLSRAQVKYSRVVPDNLLAREALTESLLIALKNPDYKTVLVYGQRGAGKTTAIEQTLRTRSGVVQWSWESDEGPATTKELQEKWKSTFSPWMKPLDRNFDLDVCASILKILGKALVIVISLESATEPAALKHVLHFCKMMSYNTQLVRFVVDLSSSRAAVALQTDLTKLRIKRVVVGCVTREEANALVSHKLPYRWTDPKKQAITQEITHKFDLLLLTLIEVCEEMKEGMPTEDAIECVETIHAQRMQVASTRLKTFDTLLKKRFKDLDRSSPIPNLVKDDPGRLDPDGIDQLTDIISPPVFMEIVSEAGSPYIFDVDPFTEDICLNGKIMTMAFVQRYRKKER